MDAHTTGMADSYWECPRCGALNKPYAALCFTCGGDTRQAARRAARAADPDRVMTRGARLLFAGTVVLSALVGFALVRTFRSPALEQAAVVEPHADSGREPVPPEATMPGAPESGWPPPAAASAAPPLAPVPTVVATAPAAEERAPQRRVFSDDDLRRYVARRGVAAATQDRDYVLALRQRRVEELQSRLADARSSDEREKLREWLEGALADLERARR